MTSKYQLSFLFSLSDILCVLNPAGQNVRQGLTSLPDISRTLPDMSDMSGIFRDHCGIAEIHWQQLASRLLIRSNWSALILAVLIFTNWITSTDFSVHGDGHKSRPGWSTRASGGSFLLAIRVWCAGYEDRMKVDIKSPFEVVCECTAAYRCSFRRLLEIFRTTLQDWICLNPDSILFYRKVPWKCSYPLFDSACPKWVVFYSWHEFTKPRPVPDKRNFVIEEKCTEWP